MKLSSFDGSFSFDSRLGAVGENASDVFMFHSTTCFVTAEEEPLNSLIGIGGLRMRDAEQRRKY